MVLWHYLTKETCDSYNETISNQYKKNVFVKIAVVRNTWF